MITSIKQCGYFRRLSDNTTWAVLLIDGKPHRAVAADQPFKAHPSEYNLRNGVKAKEWKLAGLEQIGELFNSVGYRGPDAASFPAQI